MAVISAGFGDAYLHFLQQLANNDQSVADEAAMFVLNASVCFSESAWAYSTIYAGGALAAARVRAQSYNMMGCLARGPMACVASGCRRAARAGCFDAARQASGMRVGRSTV